jgi:hypothetical protein
LAWRTTPALVCARASSFELQWPDRAQLVDHDGLAALGSQLCAGLCAGQRRTHEVDAGSADEVETLLFGALTGDGPDENARGPEPREPENRVLVELGLALAHPPKDGLDVATVASAVASQQPLAKQPPHQHAGFAGPRAALGRGDRSVALDQLELFDVAVDDDLDRADAGRELIELWILAIESVEMDPLFGVDQDIEVAMLRDDLGQRRELRKRVYVGDRLAPALGAATVDVDAGRDPHRLDRQDRAL